MVKKPGFMSVRPQQVLQMHTTHCPSFLGLHQNVGLWNASNSGKGAIIGVFDTGIAPQHTSFNDNGMPSPPVKWKGKCEFNVTTYCNKKLIGAMNFAQLDKSQWDKDGHGTHTSSIATGNFVDGANFLGNANGTAVGIAPRAHCLRHYDDYIAVGVYSVMEKGFFVSCSAGNDGPDKGSVVNEAPWILTVGASTTDRKIKAVAVLGNGAEFEGESAFQPTNFSRKLLPIVNGNACELLNTSDVKGKIVLCKTHGYRSGKDKGVVVKMAGGVGMILMTEKNLGSTTLSENDVLPTTNVDYNDEQMIINYTKSTSTRVATISFKGTRTGNKHAQTVAYFSSRGLSMQSRGILKPDDETLKHADLLTLGSGHVNPS
ncbi:putative subtilisin-like protease-like [Capsicum annuum]|nr:putative subtilisin-like protease-like [Capsicum annuum]KAF3652283.1 putative subtilisin-like protease-like [Capsicum annuum]